MIFEMLSELIDDLHLSRGVEIQSIESSLYF